jgi:hypothetical protein
MSYQTMESLDPVTLRRVFLLATRQLFSDPECYGDLRDKLSRFIYSDDQKLCTLPVELDFEYNPTTLQPRHAVYVGFADTSFTPLVIDHKADISEDRARITYVQGASTALRLRCVAPVADEPLYLATVATAYYMAMSRVFMLNLGLSRFDLQTIAGPQLVDRAPTRMFEASFTAKLDFHFNIVSVLEGHRLKAYQAVTLPLTP